MFQTYDSLTKKANLGRFRDSIKVFGWADSMKLKVNDHISGAFSHLSNVPDSLEQIKLPNISNQLNADGLLGAKIKHLGGYDHFTHKMDSLDRLGVSTVRYRKQADSLSNKQKELLSELNSKQKELQQNVKGRYDEWSKSVRNKLKLDSLGIITNANIPAMNGFNISPGTIPPSPPGVPNNQNVQMGGIPSMPSVNPKDFSSLGLSNDLSKIGGKFSQPSISQLQQLVKQIPGLPVKNELTQQATQLSSLKKDPSKAAETEILKVSEVKVLNQQTTSLDKLKNSNQATELAKELKNPEALQVDARKQVEQSVNHFAGKEELINKSMENVSKYKAKYSNLGSITDLKRKWYEPMKNSLKGRPFRERFRPGIHVGFQSRKDTTLIDFFPNAAYQISGRFEVGFGAVYRVREVHWHFDQLNAVWGLNSFTTIRLVKSTRFRLEADASNCPILHQAIDGSPEREWRWKFYVGIQNNFRISKSVEGNVQMLYDFDKKLKDAFPENVTVRMGIQYKFSRKK